MENKGTWELVDLPPGRKAIGNRWTFAKKFDANGILSRYKARLVGKGFSQIPGQDFDATYAPVMQLDSLRVLLSIAAVNDLECQQMDIKGAYLNGTLNEEVYMRQPEGFSDGSTRVCLLRKTLYGLKQSGREWYRTLDAVLNKLKYNRTNDNCVYIRRNGDEYDIIGVWVDDLILLSTDKERMQRMKDEIQTNFDATDQGEPRLLLGIEIRRDRTNKIIEISQGQYIAKILEQYGFADANPISTPADPNVILNTATSPFEDPHKFRSAIGALMYAARGTRPDIIFALYSLSRFAPSSGPEHWTAVKRIFRYLKGTKDMSIQYNGNINKIEIIGYSNASYAKDRVDRRSTTGHCCFLADGVISWTSKKQPTISLSSMEAEYISGTSATQQIVWLRSLLSDLGFQQNEATVLYVDNQSAIGLAQDPRFHNRSKHIDVKFHYIREKTDEEVITPMWISTDEMIADILTKGLARPKFEKFRSLLGMGTTPN